MHRKNRVRFKPEASTLRPWIRGGLTRAKTYLIGFFARVPVPHQAVVTEPGARASVERADDVVATIAVQIGRALDITG